MNEPSNEMLPTRWSLLSRLKDWEDQDSWKQFFDAYWKLIYSTALKSGLTHAEAQEVVQETVISVAKNMGEFKASPASGSFKAWLLNLTRWRITDQLRKRPPPDRFQAPRSEDTARTATIERVADTNPADLESEWNHEYERNLVGIATQRVKGRVKPEMFQIFDLLVNKGWPALKVSRRLHVSLAQVYYARYKLTSLMKREVRNLEKTGL
ncbi:MAG: sigma-70 family RNA polymerase sigma factor [Pedosphaera sp.]|nr:sigma-70 family RNA polymerase sigma factor [Pedosphaera sp.]